MEILLTSFPTTMENNYCCLHFFADYMHVALPSDESDQWKRTTEVKVLSLSSALLSW